MILVILAAVCLITVPLTGGHLGRLAELRLRCLWLAPLALAVQVLIVTIAPDGNRSLHTAVHIGTYVLIGIFLGVNLRLPGVRVIAAGALSNAIAIVTNGGVMPASAWAARIAGLTERAGFNNSAQLAHPHLQLLGDLIPVPGPWPLQNVLSIGDCLIFAGMLVLLHRTCGPSATSHAQAPKQHDEPARSHHGGNPNASRARIGPIGNATARRAARPLPRACTGLVRRGDADRQRRA